MNPQLFSFITTILSGAIGGNVLPAIKERFSIGVLGNTLAGVIGGGLGAQILTALLSMAGVQGSLATISSASIGGLVVSYGAALLKEYMSKRNAAQPPLPQM